VTIPTPDHIIVRRMRIIGTPHVVYRAWERAEYADRHPTITRINDRLHGMIGSDPDHDLYGDLPPGSAERRHAVSRAYDARQAVAYEAIRRAFPDDVPRMWFANGEATVHDPDGGLDNETRTVPGSPAGPVCDRCNCTGVAWAMDRDEHGDPVPDFHVCHSCNGHGIKFPGWEY